MMDEVEEELIEVKTAQYMTRYRTPKIKRSKRKASTPIILTPPSSPSAIGLDNADDEEEEEEVLCNFMDDWELNAQPHVGRNRPPKIKKSNSKVSTPVMLPISSSSSVIDVDVDDSMLCNIKDGKQFKTLGEILSSRTTTIKKSKRNTSTPVNMTPPTPPSLIGMDHDKNLMENWDLEAQPFPSWM